MPTFEVFSQGTPSWVELGSPNLNASMDFYARIFGWAFDEGNAERAGGNRYARAKISSGCPAGIFSLGDNASGESPVWHVQVAVDDMHDVVSRVGDYGGAVVVAPFEEGEFGTRAVISEPSGGQIDLWRANSLGPVAKHEHGALQWCELMTPDPVAAAEFFRMVLRVKTEPMEMPDGMVNSILVTDDGPIASVNGTSGLETDVVSGSGPFWVVYFNVDDVDAVAERAVRLGATLPDPPWDTPGVGRMAWINDPQGALLGLITPPSS